MQTRPLIAEDVLLVLLDDASGGIRGEGTLHFTLGGAVLVELALDGSVEIGDTPGITGRRVRAVPGRAPGDPILAEAYAHIAEKERGANTVIVELGTRLRGPMLERLVERGFVREESKRFLWLFPHDVHPSTEAPYEVRLLGQVRSVLVDGAAPADERVAALVALLSASDVLPLLHSEIPWSGPVYTRGKALENGDWGAEAVGAAVTANVAAIAASSVAVSVAVASATGTA